MSTTRPTTETIKLDIYRETQNNLLKLGEVFPRDFLQSLAGDVLHNVARHAHFIQDPVANPSEEHITELSEALISDDDTAGATFIANIQHMGASPETVYLKYLAEAARTLGVWWEKDQVTFATVTLGSSRIYSIMSAMRHMFKPLARPKLKSAVFATVPGEEHILGVRMAADIFRREGWHIDLKVGHDDKELVESIDWSSTCLIGLSYSGVHSLQPLTRLMLAIRLNGPAVETIVCGHHINTVKEVADIAGVSACSDNVEDALSQMNRLWDTAFIAQA